MTASGGRAIRSQTIAGQTIAGRDGAVAGGVSAGAQEEDRPCGGAIGWRGRASAAGSRSPTSVKQFEGGVLAVDHVSFDAEPGEFVSMVGPSGCGKSTLLRLIAGLIPLSGGDDLGERAARSTEPRQDVALMFQRPDPPALAYRAPERAAAAARFGPEARRGRRARGLRAARPGRAERLRAHLPAPSLGRHAAAGGARPPAHGGRRRAPARRAVRGGGPAHPRAPEPRAAATCTSGRRRPPCS